MRKLLLTLALLVVAPALRAQDGLRDMVEARRVRDFIYVTIPDDSTFYYQIDSRTDNGRSKRMPGRATIRVEETDGFVLLLGFRNPLHSTWSVGQVDTDDATYVSGRKFVEAISTLFTTVGAGTSATGGSALAGPSGLLSTLTLAALPSGAREAFNNGAYAPGVVEWLMWLPERDSCFRGQRTELVEMIAAIDSALYGAGKPSASDAPRGSTVYNDSLRAAFKRMADAKTAMALEDAVLAAGRVIAQLATSNDQAKQLVAGLERSIADANIGPNNDSRCGPFASFTKSQGVRMRDDAAKVLAQRARVASTLDTLRMRVVAALNARVDSGAYRIADVKLTEGKAKELTITVSRHPMKLDDDGVSVQQKGDAKVTMVLREAQTFIVEFASGAIYTEIAYPKYGTSESNGTTLVARAGDNVQRGAAVGMLNVIPNFKLRGFFYPMAQIGVGTGKEYPLLMAGGGFRLARPFSLSLTGGAAWTWNRDLKSLKVGEQVAGTADIESNLEYRFQRKPHFYLGLQNSF